ncbi:uncharacterized protein LOC143031107 isoform X5 [Oratosquilla oratoria]|uniref:uncharacterized protein LOC143031107 isoform X5 n=1 Tax=Oratosquilla oratoria TaxID=337810 RepID=UPI003F76F162
MAEELLSLKWNNHQAHFVDILTFLREQEIFVDATLACGGKLYPAHKFVLSTCSDYFKQMFTKNPSKHPIVFMKDVSCRDLEALLDFMYNGEVNVPQSSLGSLIKTAEGLQIKGLAVPDDPPTKRERKDTKSSHDSHHSPPPKRRARDRSPPLPLGATHSSSSHTTSTPTASKSRSPPPPPTIAASSSSSSSHSSQSVMPPVEATLDEDSRTSVHSGQSEQNTSVTTPSLGSKPQPPPPPVSNQLSSSSQENQQIQHDASQSSQGSEEPSPGPSGLHRSKEEVELDIKQEDFVEIGDEDEGDWGVEGEGGGDSSMGSENPPNFPEVMLPTDGSVPPAGDPAMMGSCLEGPLSGAGPPGFRPLAQHHHHHHHQQFWPDVTTTTITTSANTTTAPAVVSVASPRLVHVSTSSSTATVFGLGGVAGEAGEGGGGGYGAARGPPERRHVCPVCGKGFKMKHHLVEHEVVHRAEKPFKCGLCSAAFKRAKQVKYHMRTHHAHAVQAPTGAAASGMAPSQARAFQFELQQQPPPPPPPPPQQQPPHHQQPQQQQQQLHLHHQHAGGFEDQHGGGGV